MSLFNILGADISKDSIDFVLLPHQSHLKIQNHQKGFTQLLQWLTSHNVPLCQLRVVMEHTGHYSCRLEAFLHHKAIFFTKVPALQIARSIGMVRGKTDKADAQRIARYGQQNARSLVAARPPSPVLQRLRLLSTARAQIVAQRAAQKNALKQLRQSLDLQDSDSLVKIYLDLIRTFDEKICAVEQQMQELLSSDTELWRNYTLLQSIKGVGPVLSLATLVKTENFMRFSDARKFACYCGVAPFEHSSGSSIRGKTRVSHLADKGMKTLLDLAAKSAIQHDGELKGYYQSRLQKGKSGMSTLNVVRNKLLYRMFAIIKRQTPFQENYLKAA